MMNMHMESEKIYSVKKKRLNVTMWQNNRKMINFGDVTKENIKEDNPNWP